MPTLDFNEIAKFVNYSKSTQIAVTPLTGTAGRWALHQGHHRVRTSTYPFNVLYLYAAATLSDIRAACRAIQDRENTEVVYAASLEKTVRSHPEIISLLKPFKDALTGRDYLLSFIKDELQVYLEKLQGQAPKFYIDPKVTTPSGIPIKTPNPLVSFLLDPDTDSGAFGGKLAIMLAEPGQGKTYMSRHLVASLSRGGAVTLPLMVDSSQWHALSLEDQLSLPVTITNSFRHFHATISWLDGHEDEFLHTTLKADLFRVVFDGFDEYVLRNRGIVTPLEVLETLAELASSTGSRIIITSRTSFWHSILPEDELNAFVERTSTTVS